MKTTVVLKEKKIWKEMKQLFYVYFSKAVLLGKWCIIYKSKFYEKRIT